MGGRKVKKDSKNERKGKRETERERKRERERGSKRERKGKIGPAVEAVELSLDPSLYI